MQPTVIVINNNIPAASEPPLTSDTTATTVGMTPAANPSLFIVLDAATGKLKVGTCQHCVVEEGLDRPLRAWDAKDDSELDFKRDALLEALAKRGVILQIEDQYICP